METQPARGSPVLAAFLIVAALLLAFSFLSAASIGILIIPIPLVMLGSLAWWRRPWVVAGLVTAAVVGSMVYVLSAPLTEFHVSTKQGGVTRESGGCARTILPDVPLDQCDDAARQSLALAILFGLAGGLGTGLAVRRLSRKSEPARL